MMKLNAKMITKVIQTISTVHLYRLLNKSTFSPPKEDDDAYSEFTLLLNNEPIDKISIKEGGSSDMVIPYTNDSNK